MIFKKSLKVLVSCKNLGGAVLLAGEILLYRGDRAFREGETLLKIMPLVELALKRAY